MISRTRKTLSETDNVLAQVLAIPTWDGRCFECGQNIGLDEEHWFWAMPTQSIHLHISCFIDWAPRIAKALAELEEQTK